MPNTLITRRTDNAYPPVAATITRAEWDALARQVFGWRTTGGYCTYSARIQGLGSSDYDKLVRAARQ